MNKIILMMLVCLLFSCNNITNQEKDIVLIAHAGGEINGDHGTNSLEALQKAITDGYRYVELDLCLTSDSVLVAAHDWKTFNERTGYSLKKDSVPSLEEFQKRRILGKYTPITAEKIGEILQKNSNIHLVTDKISDYQIIDKYFFKYKKQLVIESFRYEDYQELKKRGYHKVMYSDETRVNEYQKMIQLFQHSLFSTFFSGTEINEMAVGRSFFRRKKNRFILDHSKVRLTIYTINNLKDIPIEYFDKIDMIYTDSIKPLNSGKVRVVLNCKDANI